MISAVLMILGGVMVFEGIPYFVMPDQLKQMMAQIQEMENSTLRIIGFIMIIGGLAVLAVSRI